MSTIEAWKVVNGKEQVNEGDVSKASRESNMSRRKQSVYHNHSESVSAKADDATATTDPNIMPAPMLPTAPFSSAVLAAVVEFTPEVEAVELPVVVPVPVVLVPVDVEVLDNPVPVEVELAADATPVPPALAGAATALEGSTRAPTPHGTGSLVPGWVALGAATVWPVAEAMVKRVVQVLPGAPGAVNW